MRIDEKTQKKKLRRQKKKLSQQMAREAKTLNKFQSDGSFLEAYLESKQGEPSLGKRAEHESDEEGSSGDSEQGQAGPSSPPAEPLPEPEPEAPRKSLKVETRIVDKDEEHN